MIHMTPIEFCTRVIEVMQQCGYPVDAQHPVDLAANLSPVMQAYAAGFDAGIRGRRENPR